MPGISAIGMLLRTAWRRHWRASLFLAVIAGLAASVIGASFQAAARADTSLERFRARSETYDRMVSGARPASTRIASRQEQFIEKCANLATTERLREMLSTSTASSTRGDVAGRRCRARPDGQEPLGRLTRARGNGHARDRSTGYSDISRGPLLRPGSADEIVISEDAAKSTGLHAGDTVRMSSWHQSRLDAAVDGIVAPQLPRLPRRSSASSAVSRTPRFPARHAVGLDHSGRRQHLRRPAWTAAHGDGLPATAPASSCNCATAVGNPCVRRRAAADRANGWFAQPSSGVNVDLTAVRRVIDLERRHACVFRVHRNRGNPRVRRIGRSPPASKGVDERPRAHGSGHDPAHLRAVNVARALTVARRLCVVARDRHRRLSPYGPLGLARKLEYELPVASTRA